MPDDWILDTPPPPEYDAGQERVVSSRLGRIKSRKSDRVCEDCGSALYDVFVDGEWHDAGDRCSVCHGKEKDAEWVEAAIKRAEERASLNYSARLNNFVTDLPHQERGLVKAQDFVDTIEKGKPGAIVFFSHKKGRYSGYGVGKTHLASAIAYEMQQRGWIVQTWLAPDLFSQVRASYGNDSDVQEHAILHPAKVADLVVIDDVGKENARQEWRQDLYFRVIDARYRNGPLVITTNLEATEELPDHIGEAAYSRLWEMASSRWWVDMCGPDWRVRIAQDSN